MAIDHIIPLAADGETTLDNLALTCVGCNGFKLDFQSGMDPETGTETRLFHPRTDMWYDHFQWSEDGVELKGVTAIGRATVVRLRMNREAVKSARQRWVAVGWHPPKLQT
jgi:hypothetical protein